MNQQTTSQPKSIRWLPALALLWLLSACQGPETPASPKTPQAASAKASTAHSAQTPHQAAFTDALMTEALHGQTAKALKKYKALMNTEVAPGHLRALAMFHVVRLLYQKGKAKDAAALAKRLRSDFPKQTHLHTRLFQVTPWPQRKLNLQIKQVDYGKLLRLLAQIGKVNIALKSTPAKKKITVNLKSVTWAEALRTVVWSVGDDVQRTAKGFVVAPRLQRRQANTAGHAIDLRESEIPARLRWIAELARKSGLSFLMRRSGAQIQEQGLGYYAAYGRCRGTRQALINFLGRLKLLPFSLQLQTFQLRELGHDIVEASVYLGLVYLQADGPSSPRTVASRPTSRPKSNTMLQTYLKASQIRAVIRAEKDGVKRCYTRHKKELADKKQHRMIIKMKVSASGKVATATVPASQQRHPKMSSCLAAWAKSLGFPKAQKNTVISYPFVFKAR